MSPRTRTSTGARVMLLVSGTGVASLGYLFTVASGVGNGPLFAVQDGLHHRYGVSLAWAALLCGLALVTVAALLRAPLGPGTVAIPVVGASWIAVLEPGISPITTPTMRWPVFVVATIVMMLGAVIAFGAALGASAMDGVMLGLSARSGWSPAVTRLTMETSLAISGALLGGRVGAGTIVMGVLVGPLFSFWRNQLVRIGLPLPPRNSQETVHAPAACGQAGSPPWRGRSPARGGLREIGVGRS